MDNTGINVATKDDERKALAKIKKIVESLGEDSYVRTAFEGCFEVAESNIENDWACSMKQRSDNWEIECGKLCSEIDKLKAELEEEKRLHALQLENFKTCMSNCETYKTEIEDLTTKWSEVCYERDELKEELAESEQTILGLKAKLFDLLYK